MIRFAIEKRQYAFEQHLRRFFGEVMTAGQCLAADVVGNLPPFVERPEAALDHPICTPQHEQRHRQPAVSGAVGAVVLRSIPAEAR